MRFKEGEEDPGEQNSTRGEIHGEEFGWVMRKEEERKKEGREADRWGLVA